MSGGRRDTSTSTLMWRPIHSRSGWWLFWLCCSRMKLSRGWCACTCVGRWVWWPCTSSYLYSQVFSVSILPSSYLLSWITSSGFSLLCLLLVYLFLSLCLDFLFYHFMDLLFLDLFLPLISSHCHILNFSVFPEIFSGLSLFHSIPFGTLLLSS